MKVVLAELDHDLIKSILEDIIIITNLKEYYK